MNLEQARAFALSLPEATEEPHFELTSFRVRGKIFATATPDGARMNLFVDEPDRQRALAFDPAAFEKLWWGSKAVGVTAVLARAEPAMVTDLLDLAWRRKAPKKLVAERRGAESDEA